VRQAIGELLPLAIAAAVSPFPIIGVVLMLGTPRARVNSSMFILGWLVGLAVVGAIGLIVANSTGASDDGSPSTGASLLQTLLGSVLVILAIRQWRKRPGPGEEPKMPTWMSAVDHFSPLQAMTLGFALSALNPKNLILALAAAVTIAATDLAGAGQALAFVVFSLLATLGVAAPIAVYATMGRRSETIIGNLKAWLAHNNAAIMAVIFLVIGAKVLGQGIAG
jgi:hypothetical protein